MPSDKTYHKKRYRQCRAGQLLLPRLYAVFAAHAAEFAPRCTPDELALLQDVDALVTRLWDAGDGGAPDRPWAWLLKEAG
jgi:hypothetical protein